MNFRALAPYVSGCGAHSKPLSFPEIDKMSQSDHTQKRTKRNLFAALLVTTALAGGGYAAGVLSANAAEATAPITITPAGNQPGFGDLVAKVKTAVVNIATTEKVEHASAQQMPELNLPPDSPFGEMLRNFQHSQQPHAQNALGSGFIVDPDGYIVTNNHVVDGATKITVTLTDGSTYPATVKGRDAKTDVALLKIDAKKPLPYVAFGDSDKAREGDWVIAVGNPFGLGGTVTAGIVSAHGRDINEGPYDNFLQIDAPINPGNSGGPLFDQSGKVIGIDSAIYSPTGGSVGIGFAIPSSIASKVVAQLKEHGSVARGWLGVEMQPITPALAKAMGRSDHDGVIVDKVMADSPAAVADLRQGDVVTAVDGNVVKGSRELAMTVAGLEKGSTAKLTVWRDGKERTIDVKIGAQPSDDKLASAEDGNSEGPVGLSLAPLSKDTRSEYGLDEKTKGVVVQSVAPDSHAADSGIQPGDVIVRIGNQAVTSPAEAATNIHAAENAKKDAVPLLVMRNGSTYYLALQLG
jgi:serine protease Do